MPPHQQPTRRRRINGDRSVYKRQDGYWVGAFYAHTTSGARKRVVVYGKTLDEARAKLGKAQQQARRGVVHGVLPLGSQDEGEIRKAVLLPKDQSRRSPKDRLRCRPRNSSCALTGPGVSRRQALRRVPEPARRSRLDLDSA